MTSRSLLRVGGADAFAFLQGIVTNDLARLSDGLVYAALLTPQGKYLADFFLLRAGADILLDADAGQVEGLLRRLSMYRLRAKVTLERSDLSVCCGLGPAPKGAFADPRHPALGWRGYGEGFEGGDVDWPALRVAHCVPETGIELTADTYVLEAGFERLNGIDFRKGCYVGQEIAARMKHKTELRKGLARVTLEGVAAPGDEVMVGGKFVGQLFTVAGDQAIAYLRFDRAGDGMAAGDARVGWDGTRG